LTDVPPLPSPVSAVQTSAGDGVPTVVVVPVSQLRRPGPGRFLWYCVGGALPPENHSWVLHDVTCRTWIARHFARWTMVILPVFALYLAVAPLDFSLRLYTGIAVALALYLMAMVFILIDSDRRAVRAGYAYSQPSAVRSANSVARQRAANYQRRERIAARRAGR
jgi:uncharacterized protein DUF5313